MLPELINDPLFFFSWTEFIDAHDHYERTLGLQAFSLIADGLNKFCPAGRMLPYVFFFPGGMGSSRYLTNVTCTVLKSCLMS
jgi:hypothetical protein